MHKIAHSFVRFAILFSLLFTLTSSAFAAPPTPPIPRAQWTVMVYMSGDNDLESYVISDIETELAATGSTPNVQILALADRGPGNTTSCADWKQTILFHVMQGMTADCDDPSVVSDWGERDMSDPQTLVDFVTWTKASYPANHYALIFWGHGWNWHPGYVMRDDTTELSNPDDFTMDYDELKPAIPSLGFIDMVGFDGCNMASIEVFNLWHGHATAVTSSQEFVWAEGLQYDLVLADLGAHSDWSAEQLAIDFTRTANADRTWSAVAVDNRLDKLLTAVNDWSVALKKGLPKYRKQYDQAFTATRSFWKAPTDKDLYDMAFEINRLVSDEGIKTTSQAVMHAVNDVVLYERHVNSYAEVHGITIYHISKATEKDSDYDHYLDLDFALQTGWDEFLDAYAK